MRILFLVNELLTVCGVTKHFYHLINGLKTQFPRNDYHIICGGGNNIQKFENLGINVILDENILHQERSIKGYFSCIKSIHSFVRKNNIQLIHSHHHYSASIANYVSKITNVKTILTNHGILPQVGILNHFEADHIIAVNKHVEEYLIKIKKKDEDQISLIPYGFPILYQDKPKNKRLKIIAGGRFVKDKGFDIYIKAIAKLPINIKTKAEFFIAGSGEEKNELVKLNDQLNANVKFLGTISDFQSQLFLTDIFVMPTLSSSEGFPTVLIEAGIAKNLLITTDFPGHNSIINKNNSLIYKFRDHNSLNNFLIQSIQDYEYYTSMINKYHEDIVARFNQRNMLVKIYDLYSKLIP